MSFENRNLIYGNPLDVFQAWPGKSPDQIPLLNLLDPVPGDSQMSGDILSYIMYLGFSLFICFAPESRLHPGGDFRTLKLRIKHGNGSALQGKCPHRTGFYNVLYAFSFKNVRKILVFCNQQIMASC